MRDRGAQRHGEQRFEPSYWPIFSDSDFDEDDLVESTNVRNVAHEQSFSDEAIAMQQRCLRVEVEHPEAADVAEDLQLGVDESAYEAQAV